MVSSMQILGKLNNFGLLSGILIVNKLIRLKKIPQKRKRNFVLGYFILFAGCFMMFAQIVPRKYIAHRTSEDIVIDGKDEDRPWLQAASSEEFIDIEGVEPPLYKTNMKMLWDEEYLYFFAQLEEPHIWATLKQRDTVIFYNNDFEIFIDPDGDTHNYMEFEINALNTIWDLFLTKPYRDKGKVLDSWDIRGIKTAVHINGTINDPSDKDTGWSVEVAMPWEVLKEANSHSNIPENEFWRIGFSRVNWKYELIEAKYVRKKDPDGKYLPEFNWVWSPQWVINMHEPEKWGYVYFSADETGTETDFTIPMDEHIKWYLYELYRDLKNEKGRQFIWENTPAENQATGPSKSFFGKQITPILESNTFGFHLWARSPFTQSIMSINEDGKFMSHAEN